MNFIELLDLEKFDDLTVTTGGIRASHRPDIARYAYDIRIIASSYEDLIETGINDFLRGANRAFFDAIFKNTNGLRIGAHRFATFGFTCGDQSIGVPLDIEPPNLTSAAARPPASLIVGTSTEASSSNSAHVEHYHTIQSDARILVTPKNDFSTIKRAYTSVEDWIKFEVERAMNDRVITW